MKNLRQLPREHKTAIHMVTIVAIGLSLFAEHGGTADWLFLALSILVEVD